MVMKIIIPLFIFLLSNLLFGQIPTSGLVAYYPFNGNSNDSSGNGYHGIVSNGVTFDTSPFGSSVHFYDRTTYVSINQGSLNFNGWSALTISAWIKMQNYTTYGTVFDQGRMNMDHDGIILNVGGSWGYWIPGVFAVTLEDSAPEYVVPHTFAENVDPMPSLEVWYHVVGTYDGEHLRYYVNGVLDGEKAVSSEHRGNRIWSDPNAQSRIGMSANHPDWYDMHLSGLIDEVIIYNRALTDSEIQSLYREFPWHIGPQIISVKDTPNDQGGKVGLVWESTYLDKNATKLPFYSIWRSTDKTPAEMHKILFLSVITPQFSGMAFRTTTVDGKEYTWEWIANQPSHKFAMYSYTATTLFDSMSTTNGLHYFLVSAHTDDPNVFYDSNIDSGYSVDNLSPSPPKNVEGRIVGNDVVIGWNSNREPDLSHFEIYRSFESNFNPDTMTAFAIITDSTYREPILKPFLNCYYSLLAVDIHGNRSEMSNKVAIIVTGLREKFEVPKIYSLSQNYPNPFNPSTTIRYALPSSAKVKLAIYDLLGREIATLVNEEQSAGWKEVKWNAINFASGMYFYTLTAGNFVEIKRMMLIK